MAREGVLVRSATVFFSNRSHSVAGFLTGSAAQLFRPPDKIPAPTSTTKTLCLPASRLTGDQPMISSQPYS